MPKFNVTMFTTIYKTVTVEAETAEAAGAKAYADNPIDLSGLGDNVQVDDDSVHIEQVREAAGIDWDVDDEADLAGLPTTVEIPGNVPDDEVADWLSDKFGFCVNGFTIN